MPETDSALAEQFRDLEQQWQAAQLGMWIFLVTEIMFFGGLFMAYTFARALYPTGIGAASRHMALGTVTFGPLRWRGVTWGAVNTAVLISSSLTMALGVYAAQLGRRKMLVAFLALTMVLGGVFLGIKAIEYTHKFEDHLVPGPAFSFPGTDRQHAQLFFSLYFAMTGLHALHMVVGIGIVAVLLGKAWRGRYSVHYHAPVEISGLYWHFVDIIWIFLFPLLYLINIRH